MEDIAKISEEMSKRLARCYHDALCYEVELKDGHSKHVGSSKNILKMITWVETYGVSV